jgi:superfamily I DNA/RNA helicase
VAVLLRTNALVAEWTKGLENMGVKVHSRAVTLPVDWQMVLNYLALLNEPGNDWLAYSTLVAFRGREVADQLRAQALAKLTTINACALNIPENIAVPLALEKLATVASVEAMTVLRELVKQSPPEIEVHDLLLAAQRAVFPEKEAPGVTVTTGHSSKGLEFDFVCAPALEEGILPLKVADRAEEMRLLYVMMTRARHVLQLSYATQRRNPFSKQLEATKPSSFLEHIGGKRV